MEISNLLIAELPEHPDPIIAIPMLNTIQKT